MSCHGAGRWARTARYSGCSKKPWRGGFSRSRSGKPGHGVEPAPVDGEGAHAVEGRGLAIDGAGGRPGGAPGELVLADLIRGQRGGPRLAAEEGDEMGDPAAGGALGPELPDVVVLEVGVAELAQGRPLGAEGARGRCRCAGGIGRAGRTGVVRGHGRGSLLCGGRRRAARRSTLALWGAAGKRNVRRIWSARIGGSGGCRRRPATGRARSTGHKRAISAAYPVRRVRLRAPAPPEVRPTPPAPDATRGGVGGCVRRGGGVGRGGVVARRGPAVGLAGARRRGGPVRPGGQPGIALKTTRHIRKTFRIFPYLSGYQHFRPSRPRPQKAAHRPRVSRAPRDPSFRIEALEVARPSAKLGRPIRMCRSQRRARK